MFTSRAEFRLSLREDNADLRLSAHGRRIGLLNDEDWARFEDRRSAIASWKEWMARTTVKSLADVKLSAPQSVLQLLRRPDLSLSDLLSGASLAGPEPISEETKETLEIEVKYEGYIAIQRQEIERLSRMQELDIPQGFDFEEVAGLSTELRQKLAKVKPKTLAEASRISGVTPAAMTALLFHLRQKGPRPAHASL